MKLSHDNQVLGKKAQYKQLYNNTDYMNNDSNTDENNTKAIDIAKDIIKSFEGLSLVSYYCPAKQKTIGYGHVIKANDQHKIGERITKTQAEDLLKQDIEKACRILSKYCFVPLAITQQAALISFIFNCSGGAFQSSTLRQKLNRGEYMLAADELLKWVYAGGIKLNGLVKRRALEPKVFLSDLSEVSSPSNNIRGSSINALMPSLSLHYKERCGIIHAIKGFCKKFNQKLHQV